LATRTRSDADVQLELGGVLAPPLDARAGLTRGEVGACLKAARRVIPELLGPKAESGFLKLPRRRSVLAEVAASARRWRRRKPEHVIHVGIGGSSLGAEAIFRALAHPLHNELPAARRTGPRVHFVDNVDPERLAALLDAIDLRRSLVHVVSKSGGTVDPSTIPVSIRTREPMGGSKRTILPGEGRNPWSGSSAQRRASIATPRSITTSDLIDSPRAILIWSWTRSIPVISSVMPCSTCRRGLTSRK